MDIEPAGFILAASSRSFDPNPATSPQAAEADGNAL
jgi:hypothetical protein